MSRYRISIEVEAEFDAKQFFGQEQEGTFQEFRDALDGVSLVELISDWYLENESRTTIEDTIDGHKAVKDGDWSWEFTDNTESIERDKLREVTKGMEPLFPGREENP